jgi:hypothetical protein
MATPHVKNHSCAPHEGDPSKNTMHRQFQRVSIGNRCRSTREPGKQGAGRRDRNVFEM